MSMWKYQLRFLVQQFNLQTLRWKRVKVSRCQIVVQDYVIMIKKINSKYDINHFNPTQPFHVL